MSIALALDPVFKFLEMGFGTSRNIGVSYAAAFSAECGLHGPEADITSAPSDDNFNDDVNDQAAPAEEAAQSKGGFFSRLLGRNKTPAPEEQKSTPKQNTSKRSASTMNIGVEHEEKLTVQDFDLLKVVGKGAFGKVMLVRKKAGKGSGQIYAMKVLMKSVIVAKGQEEHTKSERAILCEIRHPYIVQLRFAFQSEDKLYLVTDYYNGGSLFYHLRKSRAFPEERAKFYGAQLLSALDHLHSQHIIYRDLKLENVLMDNLGNIALTDFGLSKQNIDQSNGATTFCGTAEYIAPELLKGQRYSAPVDWWSFGILLYEMITGRTPFYDKNRKVILHILYSLFIAGLMCILCV
jgi:serine/threonine protein kinase